jgi:hypothetical protein
VVPVTGHEFVRPGQTGPGTPPPDACMTCGQSRTAHDWRALREWLIKTYGEADRHSRETGNINLTIGFTAQVEVLSSALDFMDERERES